MASTEAQSQEMKGRSRLKGVLDDLVLQSKEGREMGGLSPDQTRTNSFAYREGEVLAVDEDVEEGARDLMELNEEGGNSAPRKRGRPAKSPSRRRGRKRLCKDVYYQSQDSDTSETEERHIPHVMTLFDRRVDLARFTSDTPLYVMCREWMWNNPLKTSQSPNLLIFSLPNTLSLPIPLDVHQDSGGAIRLDIPRPHPPHTTNQQDLDKILEECLYDTFDLPELKSDHLNRWRNVRERWRQASALNQRRYSESLTQLREMFQR